MIILLKTHYQQIVANRVMRSALIPLRKHLRAALNGQKDTIGYNLAALQYIQRRNEADRSPHFYDQEVPDEERVRARIMEGRKRKRIEIKT